MEGFETTSTICLSSDKQGGQSGECNDSHHADAIHYDSGEQALG
jgi:hypothetical protein